jgi:DNA-binding response OmpR family regulator
VPDLIILDWMLPDMVGPEICKLIRERGIDVPVLMLTGRAKPTDIAAGLVAGADDYLVKPFSTIELMARVKALLRRTAPKGKVSRLVAGGLILDKDSRRVHLNEKPIDLSPKEFKLLAVLMENSGRTLTTEALLNEVWGLDFEGDVKTVAVHVRWLRQKLESDPKNPRIVETVHKAGYRLNPA